MTDFLITYDYFSPEFEERTAQNPLYPSVKTNRVLDAEFGEQAMLFADNL